MPVTIPARLLLFLSLATALCSATAQTASTAAPELARSVSHGRFHNIPVRLPAGEARRFVLWFADGLDAAQRKGRVDALVADGAMVATVEVAALERSLRGDGGACVFSSGDVENFSRFVQAYYRLPTYRLPLLLGDGEGAALAYAIAAQGGGRLFAGAVAVDFCPRLALPRALCPSGALKLTPARDGRSAQLQPAPLSLPWLVAALARIATMRSARFRRATPSSPRSRRRAVSPAMPAATLRLACARRCSASARKAMSARRCRRPISRACR